MQRFNKLMQHMPHYMAIGCVWDLTQANSNKNDGWRKGNVTNSTEKRAPSHPYVRTCNPKE